MNISYIYCAVLVGYIYVLKLVDRATWYIWTYGMYDLSRVYIIEALQDFCLDTDNFPTKLCTDFDNCAIR